MTIDGPCRFAVRLTPRSDRDAVVGVEDGALVVRVTAPPVDGAANEALLRLLARELGVGWTALAVESGATARRKRLRVALPAHVVRARWPGLAVGT